MKLKKIAIINGNIRSMFVWFILKFEHLIQLDAEISVSDFWNDEKVKSDTNYELFKEMSNKNKFKTFKKINENGEIFLICE